MYLPSERWKRLALIALLILINLMWIAALWEAVRLRGVG